MRPAQQKQQQVEERKTPKQTIKQKREPAKIAPPATHVKHVTQLATHRNQEEQSRQGDHIRRDPLQIEKTSMMIEKHG